MASFKVKIAFIVFCSYFLINFAEAKFKPPIFSKKKSPTPIPEPVFPAIPGPSYQNIGVPKIPLSTIRKRPAHSSMSDISLYARPSSSISSKNSLNIGSSPAIMKESETLHRQAALALNAEKLGLKKPDRLKLFASIAKNFGLGISAIGGTITIGKSLSSDKVIENDDNNNVTTTPATITTTTTTDEIQIKLKDE